MDESVKQYLGNTSTDINAVLAKSITGSLPVIGSLVSEIIGNVIPNQRVDRIARFVELLNARVQDLEQDALRTKMMSNESVDVLEDAFFQAARATTQQRLEHIADVVANGLRAQDFEYAETKRMLWLLGQLNDLEVILLRGKLPDTNSEYASDREFQDRHSDVLRPRYVSRAGGSDPNEVSLFDSFKTHLVALGLLRSRYKKPKRGELPEFDYESGTIEAAGQSVSRLGRIFLRYVSLLPEWAER